MESGRVSAALRTQWAPELLDEVVCLELARRAARGDAGPLAEYRGLADAGYARPAGDRERSFAALHARFFERLGFGARARAVLEAHGSLLECRIPGLAMLRARHPGDEGADLGAAGPGGRPACLRTTADRWLGDDLERFLDHELLRLGDLVDPGFGHDADAVLALPPHRRRDVQAAYRTAWAASLDGRLARRDRAPLAGPDEHRRRFARSFGQRPEVDRMFQAVWGNDRPTHAFLLAVAVTPGGASGQPGRPCPLCAFPTHRWAGAVPDAMVDRIRADVPGWTAADGLCERCREGYEARAAMAR
jgi:hypothetical protein